MTRLSSPLTTLKSEYTVVVVGSGYGGGIAASRLARAGQAVCVLERGRERQPGEYPDTLPEAAREVQADTPAGRTGSPTAMFDFRVNPDIAVVVGCGLGGTSLINANVSIRPEPRVFDDPRWPAALRADLATLVADGYRRAEEMLRPNPYPAEFPPLPKLEAQERSAAAMGERFERLSINVTFRDGVNHVGVEQRACVLCGDCVSGCNHGAKNTTLMNYLPDAVNHGAEIFTEIEVRRIERAGDRWVVHAEPVGTGRDHFEAPTLTIRAAVVVLAAGTLGTTEILLRSKARGLSMSDRVGARFSGNGDVLGFAYNGEHPIRGVGFGHRRPGDMEPVGPCISSVIDMRDRPRLDDGLVIEEGSIPGAIAPLLGAALAATAAAVGDRSGTVGLGARARELESLVRGAYAGAVAHTQTYLIMSHDDAGGRLYLENDRLRIEWPGVGRQREIVRDNRALAEASRALGARYVPSPTWTSLLGHSLVTVHPLGGAAMAERAEDGVVDHRGLVFAGTSGMAVHEGLYVADGAVVPRSLGVNPLLTISALAERTMALLARERGWTIDYRLPSAPRTRREARAAGVAFTETMKGFFAPGERDDFAAGAAAGQRDGSSFEFTLTVESENVERMVAEPEHAAAMYGTVVAPRLSPEPLTVTEGRFNLFVTAGERGESRRMRYRMKLTSRAGRVWYFDGFKRVEPGPLTEMWRATSTLYVTVHDGDGETSPVLGRGILTIHPADFARQLTTMDAPGAADLGARLTALTRFGRFFAGELFDVYGPAVAGGNAFDPAAPPRKRRPLRTPPAEIHGVRTSDGADLRLIRHAGGSRGPVLVAPGFGTSTLAFSTDTVETNLPEYLTAHGYDVWLFDYRASPALPSAATQFTLDDVATRDWPAAVDYVRKQAGVESVQVVAHCMGSLTCFMALLAGMGGVRSFVASQVTPHPVVAAYNEVRAGIHLGGVLSALGLDRMTTEVGRTLTDDAIDAALRLFPVPADERCDSRVCRRIFALYGRVYSHARLGAATHAALGEMFGVANIETFEHIQAIIRAGRVVDHQGRDVYLPHVGRLAFPITFLHGAENRLFYPEGSAATYRLLAEANGERFYTRHVVPDYAHMDCFVGQDAARDVFPIVRAALDQGN